jgi:hypothetical protein
MLVPAPLSMGVHIILYKRYERMQRFSMPHLFAKANALGKGKRYFRPVTNFAILHL